MTFLRSKFLVIIYISCMQLDDGIASDCGAREVSYTGLQDGNHTFVVCSNGSLGVSCSSYNWIVG